MSILSRTNIAVTAFAVFLATAGSLFAADSVVFPVPELGNCAHTAACKAYCDQAEHRDACIEFAQRHGLVNHEQAIRARNIAEAIKHGGPGGCATESACKRYCTASNHAQECLAFAARHGLVPARQTNENKKTLELIRKTTPSSEPAVERSIIKTASAGFQDRPGKESPHPDATRKAIPPEFERGAPTNFPSPDSAKTGRSHTLHWKPSLLGAMARFLMGH